MILSPYSGSYSIFSFSNFLTNLRNKSRLHASIFHVSLFTNISRIYNVNKFITKLTMISFSTGSDSAIINVIATNAPSLILFSPFLYKNYFYPKIPKIETLRFAYSHPHRDDLLYWLISFWFFNRLMVILIQQRQRLCI